MGAFQSADHFSLLHLNQDRDCRELKSGIQSNCLGWNLGWIVLLLLRITFLGQVWIRVGLSRIEKQTFHKTGLVEIVHPASVELLGERFFHDGGSLSSLTFESGSRLSWIEKQAFRWTVLVEIILLSLVEILGEECFSCCESLSSVTFESGSDCHELKSTHSVELVWLKSFVLHRLMSWVRVRILCKADRQILVFFWGKFDRDRNFLQRMPTSRAILILFFTGCIHFIPAQMQIFINYFIGA
jgi:hypothetical protein